MITMSKEEMIQSTADTMKKLYYEDVEFFYGLIAQYAQKKGLECEKRGSVNARCSDNS